MDYIEISISCLESYLEILMAELAELGYDSIIETDTGFNAYITTASYDHTALEQLIGRYTSAKASFDKKLVARENWNAKWEENYDPIEINKQCIVRAPFHKLLNAYLYDIIITPKMSFGTGHHETTFQVLLLQLEIDHQDKTVMDAGCGTGVLSIMAEKRGASRVDSFDIDEWCVDNSQENYTLNNCQNCTIQKGTISQVELSQDPYDIIIANINKNILLEEMDHYAKHLIRGGVLLLSGFYTSDLKDIKSSAAQYELSYQNHLIKNNWVAASFVKGVE